jgi:hypothetical protein
LTFYYLLQVSGRGTFYRELHPQFSIHAF